MDKTTVVVSCPIDTYSGYGARARDFVKALLKLEKYDVKVLSQRWGNTSFGYLKDHNETELQKTIIQKIEQQPDIWIPVAPQWIEGCNRMDLVLTSSEHSKKIFETTRFDKADNAGRVVGALELTTKVEVLFEGLDVSKYFKTKSDFNLDSIKESFCFLFVGHWLQGDFGQDRKNIGYTIKAFLETFKNKKDAPALVLKTSMGTSSHMNTATILDKIDAVRKTVKGKLPNIYLIDGDMNDSEINALYNHPKVKAMISLTKGEGFGRPLLEFSATGKPIIASNWSGHIDFLSQEFNKLIGGTLTQVHKSAIVKDVILPESSWFTPDDGEVGKALKDVYKNYKKYQELSKRQAYRTNTEFTFDKMTELLSSILTDNLPIFPKVSELNLENIAIPKLKVK